MSEETKFRVTYTSTLQLGGPQVKLSEIITAGDLDSAVKQAKYWAKHTNWILKAVEEVRE